MLPVKVGLVTSSVSRRGGGIFFAMRSLGKALGMQPGLEVEVHGVADGGWAEDATSWLPLRCEGHEGKGPAAVAWAPGMGEALRAGGYDLLHTHGIWQWPSAAVERWHRRVGGPYVVSPHGMLDAWAVKQSRWKKRVVSWWYEAAHLRGAGCVHALCAAEAEAIRAYGLRQPIAVIPNGVDLPDEKEEVRGEERLMLFMGRLHPKKGLPNALRAWARCREAAGRGNWRLVVAGWDQGGHEAELKEMATESGLRWAVVRAGDVAEGVELPDAEVLFAGPAFGEVKDGLLRRAAAFVLPSFSEGLPMSVLEAWAYRLPVVMTEYCNLPEGFAAGAAMRTGTGTDEVAAVFSDVFAAEPGALRAMGERGRALVEGAFTWPACAAQMAEVYDWQLGGGPRPAFVVD